MGPHGRTVVIFLPIWDSYIQGAQRYWERGMGKLAGWVSSVNLQRRPLGRAPSSARGASPPLVMPVCHLVFSPWVTWVRGRLALRAVRGMAARECWVWASGGPVCVGGTLVQGGGWLGLVAG